MTAFSVPQVDTLFHVSVKDYPWCGDAAIVEVRNELVTCDDRYDQLRQIADHHWDGGFGG